MLLKASVLSLCCVLGFAAPCHGQEDWNPPSAGPVFTWTAPVAEKGAFVVQPLFFFTRTRGMFGPGGDYESLPEGDRKRQFQEQLFLQYGLTDRLELDAQAAYVQNSVRQSGVKAHSSGIGDSTLFARYCLYEELGWTPHMTAVFQVKVPTGKYQHADPDRLETDLTGTGSWDPGAGIILTKKLRPFILHLDAVYSVPQRVKVDGTRTEYGRYLNYDLGVEYFLPRGFNLMVEANGLLQGSTRGDGGRLDDSDTRSLTVAPGIGWSNESVQTLVAYQRVVAGENADANDSVVFTFVLNF